MSIRNAGLVCVALGLVAGDASAQVAGPSGAFVSTLGVDTIAVERYSVSAGRLEGDILLRSPRARIIHYVADIADRRFRGVAVSVRPVGGDPAAPPTFSMAAILADSTATVEVQRSGRPDTAASGRRTFRGRAAPSVPSFPPAIGLFEQILALNPPGSEGVALTTVGSGAGAGETLRLERRTRDSIAFRSTFQPGWVEVASVDASGRITGLNSTATTIGTITRRVPSIDLDSIAARWAREDAARGAPARLSSPDTARTTVGAARVEIAYSRPSRRGRAIFGGVVPWNETWRTGADAATQLTTSADLVIGDVTIPAGKYTLRTLPTPAGTKLIVNSQTGQWGTEYDPARDVARIDMVVGRLAQPVEQFTISFVPRSAGAGLLRMAWDQTEWTVPIRTK